MKYIAILRQTGGCDYTIGCGINTITFEAETAKEAAFKLQDIVKENYSHEEHRLESIHFYEILSTYEVSVNLWYKKFDDEKNAVKSKIENDADWAEFQRLKEKFGY